MAPAGNADADAAPECEYLTDPIKSGGEQFTRMKCGGKARTSWSARAIRAAG